MLPKIHKGFNSVKGRPVISNSSGFTENISDSLDYHINPLVSNGRSYIKDTNHFLLKFGQIGRVTDGALVSTVDVVAP